MLFHCFTYAQQMVCSIASCCCCYCRYWLAGCGSVAVEEEALAIMLSVCRVVFFFVLSCLLSARLSSVSYLPVFAALRLTSIRCVCARGPSIDGEEISFDQSNDISVEYKTRSKPNT